MILAVIFLAALAALCTYLADSLTDGTGSVSYTHLTLPTNREV